MSQKFKYTDTEQMIKDRCECCETYTLLRLYESLHGRKDYLCRECIEMLIEPILFGLTKGGD